MLVRSKERQISGTLSRPVVQLKPVTRPARRTRSRAGQIAEQTDQALAQYESSLQAARAEADQARKQLVEAARHEQSEMAAASRDSAEALIEKARADLSTALDEATASIRASSEELGQLAAERILGRSL